MSEDRSDPVRVQSRNYYTNSGEPEQTDDLDFDGQSPDADDKIEEDSVSPGTHDQQEIEQEEFTANESETTGAPEQTRKKWFMIGVGGCGNNLIDSVILRKKYLEDEKETRRFVWEGGLQGYTSLNTNGAELGSSYFVETFQKDRENIIEANTLPGEEGGGFDESEGDRIIKELFDRRPDTHPFQGWEGISRKQVEDAQAVLLLHSGKKGTGSGATPRIAKKINDSIFEGNERTGNIFSAFILPKKDDIGTRVRNEATMNATIGLARVARQADVVIPFANENLPISSAKVDIDTDYAEKYFSKYIEHNRALVAFLELWSSVSIPESADTDEQVSGGDEFDIKDALQRVRDWKPLDIPDDGNHPAPILAPAVGSTSARNFNRRKVKRLINMTLTAGKLANFDETTAWGGRFLFLYPEDKYDEFRPIAEEHFNDVLLDEDPLELKGSKAFLPTDHHAWIKDIDQVYLWVILWNPRLESVDKFDEYVEFEKELENNTFLSRLEEFENEMDYLFNRLGRDSL